MYNIFKTKFPFKNYRPLLIGYLLYYYYELE